MNGIVATYIKYIIQHLEMLDIGVVDFACFGSPPMIAEVVCSFVVAYALAGYHIVVL